MDRHLLVTGADPAVTPTCPARTRLSRAPVPPDHRAGAAPALVAAAARLVAGHRTGGRGRRGRPAGGEPSGQYGPERRPTGVGDRGPYGPAVAAGHPPPARRPRTVPLRPGHRRLRLSNKPSRSCTVAPMAVRAWVAADGSGRQAGTFPAQCWAMNFDHLRPRRAALVAYGVVQAGTLPTSPKALERAIEAVRARASRPSATFVYAATSLSAGSTAALRAALYRVIHSLPAVQNLGPATARHDRHGQASAWSPAGPVRCSSSTEPHGGSGAGDGGGCAGAEREQHAACGHGHAVHGVSPGGVVDSETESGADGRPWPAAGPRGGPRQAMAWPGAGRRR